MALMANDQAGKCCELSVLLQDSAIWNARVEKFCAQLGKKFHVLDSKQIRQVVLRVGEQFGGQTDLPEFRKAVLEDLARQALGEKLTSRVPIQSLIDHIYSGTSVLSAVKQFVSNQLSVDLAQAINDQREGLVSFAKATKEEFGMAFGRLALQPAYATHSQKEVIGLDAVNEALILLEVAKLAEQVKELEL